MALLITVEGSMPDDFPSLEVMKAYEKNLRSKLALRPEDKVIVKAREDKGHNNKNGKDYIEQQDPQACPHKAYCNRDCAECQGDELKAALNILRSRGKGR